MKIPKKIKIKGKTWKIGYKWNLMLGSDQVNGLCDAESREILLSRGLSKDEKLQVFLHEFIHAVLFESHITNCEGGINILQEEIICEALSSEIVELFNLRLKSERKPSK